MQGRWPITAVLLALLLLPAVAFAQNATLRGIVTDTAGRPLSDAQVDMWTATSKVNETPRVLATARTDSAGRYRIANVASRSPFILTIRKIGYDHAISGVLTALPGESLEFNFRLAVPSLPAIVIAGTIAPAYRIDAAEISKHPVVDGLDVVLRYRPRMLGDDYKHCPRDQAPLIVADSVKYKFEWMEERLRLKHDSVDKISTYPPPRLFVNGQLEAPRNTVSVKDVLSMIRSEDIAEMRYIDCWDKENPYYANSLMVVLKPGTHFP
jgi:hypothetical protein